MIDVNYNPANDDDPVALRQAFHALADGSAELQVYPSNFAAMNLRERHRVLHQICEKLDGDDAKMPADLCEVLELLHGATYAEGAARARVYLQQAEADHGERQ
jgi:hypothetical protein